MPIQLNAAKLADFDRPIDVLEDCHRRIENFLDQLRLVAESATGDGRLTEDAALALSGALRYFANAAPKHTQDEEVSLFPRMRESDDPRVATVLAELERLEHEHDEADELHAAVDALGRRWLGTGQLSTAELDELRAHVAALQAIYAEHIRLEDELVFPLARDIVAAPQQQVIGAEMKARRRRGIDPSKHLAALVTEVPARARIFEELRLEYCCSGNVPLADACAEHGLDLDDVLRRLAAADVDTGDAESWADASVDELVEHIVSTHHAKLRAELPHAEMLVATVARVHGARKAGLVEARLEFQRMADELQRHTAEEEADVFPRLRAIPDDEAARAALADELSRMEDDHVAVADGFARLRELLDDFDVPDDACTKHRAMLDSLERLERDLHVHVHLENHVLFPRVREQLTAAS
jgi:regulator of cell morphogenesis and NO signaling